MEKTIERVIQREAADALLDNGVSVPLLTVFGKMLRVTLRRPTLAAQMSIAREYLSLGVTANDIWGFTKEQEMQFLTVHGRRISKMIALCICRSYLARKLMTPLMSWLVRNFMAHEYMLESVKTFVLLMGTEAFMPIISSAETVNPTVLRLSRTKKGS